MERSVITRGAVGGLIGGVVMAMFAMIACVSRSPPCLWSSSVGPDRGMASSTSATTSSTRLAGEVGEVDREAGAILEQAIEH